MLLAIDPNYTLAEFTRDELYLLADEEPATVLEMVAFTYQFRNTVRRVRLKIPLESPAHRVIKAVDDGLGTLMIAFNWHYADEPALSGIEAWARRDLDNKFAEANACQEEGEFAIIRQAMTAIRKELERLELYEDCAQIRETTRDLGLQKLLEAIGKE